MKWIKLADKKPREGQTILVCFRGSLKVGKYDSKHPFGPVAIDYSIGKWWQFDLWASISLPKIEHEQADKDSK